MAVLWTPLKSGSKDFNEALQYEKNSGKNFTWCQDMSLEELKKPETIAKIKKKHQDKLSKIKETDRKLIDIFSDCDSDNSCLFCHT